MMGMLLGTYCPLMVGGLRLLVILLYKGRKSGHNVCHYYVSNLEGSEYMISLNELVMIGLNVSYK